MFKSVDPTKEPLLKSIVLLSIPMMLEMAAQNLFNLVDTYFVSRISYKAIGALVSSSITMMVIYSISIGISTACGMYIAYFWGAKKFSRAYFFYSNAFGFIVVLSLVLVAVFYFFLRDIVSLVGLKGDVFVYAYNYLSVSVLGLGLNFLFSLNNSSLRSISLPSLALIVMVLTNSLNAVLDPLFIFYLKMGIKGAAFSTIVSVFLGLALQLYFLFRRGFYIAFRVRLEIIKRIVKKGVYASLHLFFRIVSMLVLIRIIGGISQMAISGYSVVIRIYQVLLFLVFGIANASFVVVGQNFGAKRVDRLKRAPWYAILFGVCFVGLLNVVLYLNRDFMLGLFVNASGVFSIARDVLFFYFLSYPFVIASTIAARSSMALHDTKRPSMINLFNLWFFLLPLAYILSKHYGVKGVWASIAVSNLTAFLANMVLLKLNIRRAIYETAKG
ncbi:MATE family efflux transporter [Hippea sp. KM1]|uniref:MATE family efflux transporter n=1 Tax=Hippea sp. KM1 TaxID=944481 RepID=UPI00046D90D8|nr:MATE family efflux transporter [Hippea sp. KM1]